MLVMDKGQDDTKTTQDYDTKLQAYRTTKMQREKIPTKCRRKMQLKQNVPTPSSLRNSFPQDMCSLYTSVKFKDHKNVKKALAYYLPCAVPTSIVHTQSHGQLFKFQ